MIFAAKKPFSSPTKKGDAQLSHMPMAYLKIRLPHKHHRSLDFQRCYQKEDLIIMDPNQKQEIVSAILSDNRDKARSLVGQASADYRLIADALPQKK